MLWGWGATPVTETAHAMFAAHLSLQQQQRRLHLVIGAITIDVSL